MKEILIEIEKIKFSIMDCYFTCICIYTMQYLYSKYYFILINIFSLSFDGSSSFFTSYTSYTSLFQFDFMPHEEL